MAVWPCGCGPQDEIDALHMTNADLLRQIQDFGAERQQLDELVKTNAMLQRKLDESTKEVGDTLVLLASITLKC